MAHSITMENDGILRIRLSGNVDQVQVKHLKADLEIFLAAATQENPLNSIIFPENIGKLSHNARKFFAEVNRDTRIGMLAIMNPPRPIRILSRFISKATKGENINFFSNETEAVAWIKSK
jgi:hypothetical protein